MDFVQESNFFLSAFFTEMISEKFVFRYCRKKRMILRGKNWSFQNAQKVDIFKGVSPWILSINRNFSYRCFLQKLCLKKSFFDVLDRKQSFYDQKIEFLTGANKWTFFKGVCPWILSKNRTSSYGRFLQKSYQKWSFLILWKEKNDFKWKKLKF